MGDDRQVERWAEPIKVFSVYDDPRHVYHDPVRGGLMRGFSYTTDLEGWNRIKAGYVCILCMQPHEESYPEACSLCSFPMRRAQDKVAQEKFGGYRWMGPRTSYADELERLDTDVKPRDGHNPNAHIQVPVGIDPDRRGGIGRGVRLRRRADGGGGARPGRRSGCGARLEPT